MKLTAITSLLAVGVADLTNVIDLLKVLALLVPLIVGAVQSLRRPPRREPKPRRKPLVHPSVLPLMALLAALVCCAGCAPATNSSIVRALSSDTNAVSVHVSTVWGTVDVRRNAPQPR